MADLKTNVTIILSDDQRARVRAWYQRGGTATRKEVRRWVLGLVEKGLDDLPQPKRRAKAKPAAPAIAEDLDLTCAGCLHPLGEHVGRMRHCPLSKHVKPGARFVRMDEPCLSI